MLAREKSENRCHPTAYGRFFISSLLLPVTRLRERGFMLHKAIPGPLQGPATLNEINH